MTTASTSVHANLYLGNPETDPSPVFRDLSPEGVLLPDGTLVAWPEGAVFSVVFQADTNRQFRANRGIPLAHFFDGAGWPVGFPALARRTFTREAKRVLQSFPFAWTRWNEHYLRLYCEDGGQYLVRFHSQARVATRLAHTVSA